MARATDLYKSLPFPEPDVVFELDGRAKRAEEPKINLVIGAYRDENGLPWPLPVVVKAEKLVVEKGLNKEYLPIAGLAEFVDASVELLFGTGADAPARDTIAAVQTISGTGAVRIAAEFYKQTSGAQTPVYLSNPTWANHKPIFASAGFSTIRDYRYFNATTNGVDMPGFLADIAAAPSGSLFVLHMCAHNPTGADPTHEEWSQIAEALRAKSHLVLFDSAYLGYASGSIEVDAFSARLFARLGFEFSIAQSYAKNMGLYNERVGTFSVVTASAASAALVLGLIKNIIRPMYSNPPAHGARIAALILKTPELRAEWMEQLASMARRISAMRTIVRDELVRLGTPGNWDHVVKQIGMFSYLGITKEQAARLQEMRIFVMLSGRASIAGLTAESAVRLAKGIDQVVREVPAAGKL